MLTKRGKIAKTASDIIAAALLFVSAVSIIIRLFFGVEITDESFYVADTLAALHGNTPYVLNNFFLGSGFVFLPLPLYFLFERFVPSGEGIVLFSRICFVVFHFLCIFLTARIIKKHFSFRGALLFAACMLPCINLAIINFNYNTIPLDMLCLTQAIVFDSLEGENTHSRISLFLAGILSALSVFSNPAYVCAILISIVLISLRSPADKRLTNVLFYLAGGLLTVAAVLIPIAVRYGSSMLAEGFVSLLTEKFPRESGSKLSFYQKIDVLIDTARPIALLYVLSALAELICSAFVYKKTGKKTDHTTRIAAWIALGSLSNILRTLFLGLDYIHLYELGIAAFFCLTLILFSGRIRDYRFALYLCIYPLFFSILEYFVTTTGLTFRFGACLPALFCLLMLANERGGKSTKTLAVLSMVLCILFQVFILYHQPYREEAIQKLDTRVESGAYKGLLTTKDKADEIVMLEEYLNTLVGEDDYYAFRDCFPGGYLMVHSGKMCDITSWDVLKYSYGLNTPAKLFDYYRRRGAVPDVIVYVNFDRDPILSIEDDRIRYNDFIHKYYDLEDERSFGKLFNHVMVFRYQGDFDGNYAAWINKYNFLPD